jgi:hypothetical protein
MIDLPHNFAIDFNPRGARALHHCFHAANSIKK